jgi:hypothetical protein
MNFAWTMKIISHSCRMRNFIALMLLMSLSMAEESSRSIDDLMLPNLKNLHAPALRKFPNGVSIAVSGSTPEVQTMVLQGLNLIHGGWDFEAYRQFVEAIKIDPDCLMANFGLTFSLLGANGDYLKPRIAAADRTLALVSAGTGTELERGYVYALSKLFSEGPDSAADAFGQVASKYPNDVQLRLFEAYFRRSGFDEYGNPKPGQEAAQEIVSRLMKATPDSCLLMNTWLMLRTENLDVAKDLPMARKLCEMVSDYPPYHHLLGHYEWRSGNFGKAATAFSRSGELYVSWMKSSGLSIVDCPEWIAAEVYRAVSIASAGDYDSALAAAQALSRVPMPMERIESAGVRMMYWEAKTLEARLLMRRGAKGDAALAFSSIPKPDVMKDRAAKTKVGSFYQGLVIVLEGKKALEEGNRPRAEEMYQLMVMHGKKMEQSRAQAVSLGEVAHFGRAFNCLEILALELKGDIAMAQGKDSSSSAYNWYSGARERQNFATRMLPPICLYPMFARLSEYYLSKDDSKAALEIYKEGLGYWPSDLILLDGLKKTCLTLKDEKSAASISTQIDQVTKDF